MMFSLRLPSHRPVSSIFFRLTCRAGLLPRSTQPAYTLWLRVPGRGNRRILAETVIAPDPSRISHKTDEGDRCLFVRERSCLWKVNRSRTDPDGTSRKVDSMPPYMRLLPLGRAAVAAGSIYLTNACILIIVESLFMAWASHGRCFFMTWLEVWLVVHSPSLP